MKIVKMITKIGYLKQLGANCWCEFNPWGGQGSVARGFNDSAILTFLFENKCELISKEQYDQEVNFSKNHVVIDFA